MRVQQIHFAIDGLDGRVERGKLQGVPERTGEAECAGEDDRVGRADAVGKHAGQKAAER